MRAGASQRRPATLAVLALLLWSCASQDRAYELGVAQRGYNSAIRWGEFQAALGFIHPEARPGSRRLAFLLERFEQVRVTGYSVLSTEPGADEFEVVYLMELRLVNRHTARERAVQDRQVWRWDEESRTWWQHSGLPDISRES